MEDHEDRITIGKPTKPATQTLASRHLPQLGYAVWAIWLCLAWSLLMAHVAPTGAQGNTAIVTGAEHVFIRRGPGTEFPPFANLSEGATVEIQEMHGEWARVLTANGQSGYVRSNFLALPGERGKAVTATAVPPAVSPRVTLAAPSPTPRHAAPQSVADQSGAAGADKGRAPEEATPSRTQADQTPTPTPSVASAAGEMEKLRADLVRLNTTIAQLQRRLDVDVPKESAVPSTAPPEIGSLMTSTTILLAAIGLCIGWLLGNAYGRRHERGRRPRVRL